MINNKMANKTKTISLQGKEYAQVKDRLQEFRSANPNGLIETVPTLQDDQILFKARILKDKSNPTSAEATGHAMGQNKGAKAFEKLETIAVGRALALLGYGSDGAVASSDEMEEFIGWREQQQQEQKAMAIEILNDCKTLEELKKAFESLGAVRGDSDIINLKESLKSKLK